MKIFLDWDDTIFNTRDFVFDFSGIFTSRGVSYELYQSTHCDAYPLKKNGITAYDVELHLQNIMLQKSDFDIDAVRCAVDAFLEDTSAYVFPDMLEFLQKTREKNIQLYILSFGQSNFQSKKIEGTGLSEYFQDVFIVQEKKYVPILSVMQNNIEEAVWFFDDRAEYVDDVKKAIPSVKAVQVSRPQGRYQDDKSPSADFMIQDFSAIVKVFSA